jgi:hypothetical protein
VTTTSTTVAAAAYVSAGRATDGALNSNSDGDVDGGADDVGNGDDDGDCSDVDCQRRRDVLRHRASAAQGDAAAAREAHAKFINQLVGVQNQLSVSCARITTQLCDVLVMWCTY